MTTQRHSTTAHAIACDESGWAGENLLDGGTDVFAHASVRMSREWAAGIVAEVRERIGSPAEEYKATHLLRARHRDVLEWFLAPDGPLRADAHVYLVDKPYAVVRALADELARGPCLGHDADELAGRLQSRGERTLGAAAWARFLGEANTVLRNRRRFGPPLPPVRLPRSDGNAVLAAAAALVAKRAMEPWKRGAHDVARPSLDPLPAAVVRTAAYWISDGMRISIVHHQQSTLTAERIAQIVSDSSLHGRLDGVTLADSRVDLRLQIADFLAGVARSIASAERGGHGDATLTELLGPYVAADSVWGDDASWARLCHAG